MIAPFEANSVSDFRQRFEGTYGYYVNPKNDENILVRLDRVREDRVSFVDRHGISYYALADQGVVFKFIPVAKKLFVYNTRLTCAFRRPQRQYKRGVCSQNTIFMDVLNGSEVQVSFGALEEYSNASPSDKLLSQQFGISGGYLFLYSKPIGSVRGNKITLEFPCFKQELLDTIHHNKLNYTL